MPEAGWLLRMGTDRPGECGFTSTHFTFIPKTRPLHFMIDFTVEKVLIPSDQAIPLWGNSLRI